MSAVKDGNAQAQTNFIYRLCYWCELHKQRPVQIKVVSEQFELSVLAPSEEYKFLDYIKVTE